MSHAPPRPLFLAGLAPHLPPPANFPRPPPPPALPPRAAHLPPSFGGLAARHDALRAAWLPSPGPRYILYPSSCPLSTVSHGASFFSGPAAHPLSAPLGSFTSVSQSRFAFSLASRGLAARLPPPFVPLQSPSALRAVPRRRPPVHAACLPAPAVSPISFSPVATLASAVRRARLLHTAATLDG